MGGRRRGTAATDAIVDERRGHSQSREMHVRTIILSHTPLCTSMAESPGRTPWAARRLLPARLALRQDVGTRGGGRARSAGFIALAGLRRGYASIRSEPVSSSSVSNWMGLEGLRGDRRRPGEGGRPAGRRGADEVHPSRLLAHLPPSYRTPSIAAPAPPKGTMRSSAAGWAIVAGDTPSAVLFRTDDTGCTRTRRCSRRRRQSTRSTEGPHSPGTDRGSAGAARRRSHERARQCHHRSGRPRNRRLLRSLRHQGTAVRGCGHRRPGAVRRLPRRADEWAGRPGGGVRPELPLRRPTPPAAADAEQGRAARRPAHPELRGRLGTRARRDIRAAVAAGGSECPTWMSR